MYLFTRNRNLFHGLLSVFFGISVATFLFFSKADYICKPRTAVYCYPVLAGVATVLIAVMWSSLPNSGKTYCSLLAAMLIGFVLNLQITAMAYTEIIVSINHLVDVAQIPVTGGQCFTREMLYSLDLVRQALFKPKQIDQITQSVKEATGGFERTNRERNSFREAIRGMVEWLDDTALNCNKVRSGPYIECKTACEDAKADCLQHAWPFLCSIVDIGTKICGIVNFSESFCDGFNNFLVNATEAFANVINGIISSFIRARIEIVFKMKSSNSIGNEFLKAWNGLKDRMLASKRKVDQVYVTAKNVLRVLGPISVLLWPVYYMIRYRFGSPDYDNVYITENDANREKKVTMDGHLPTELIVFPLTEEEKEIYEVVPIWQLTPNDMAGIVWQMIFMIDLLFMAVVLIIDYVMTLFVHKSYVSVVEYFQAYNGTIFDITLDPTPRGLSRITEMMLEQLVYLQHAAELGRLVRCAVDAPPITYSYWIFYVALFLRLVFLYSNTRMKYVPSMLCARFYPRRHALRMKYLRAKILLGRERERIIGVKVDRDWLSAFKSFGKYIYKGDWLPWYIRCDKQVEEGEENKGKKEEEEED